MTKSMMFKQVIFVLFFLSCFSSIAVPQKVYITQPKSDNIKSLQLTSSGNSFLLPIININNDEIIDIRFDNLNISQPRLRYKILHCNSDWTISDIPEIDYLIGFNDHAINDYSFSNNTLVNYIHYNLQLPNRDVGFKISGNYMLVVYDEYSPNDELLTACFSVIDSKVQIGAKITGNTDIDFNREHQQLSFDVNLKNLRLQNPHDDIKVVVRQNVRFDNRVEDIKPTYIYSDRLVYEHNKALIFDAGNEYRRFETVSRQYGGLNVADVHYKESCMNAIVNTDIPRSKTARQYGKAQNGKYLIRNNEASDSNTEADYFLVNFALDADRANLKGSSGNVWLDGEFVYGNAIQLNYDVINSLYRASILLKQGSYNYQYLVGDEDAKYTSTIEGDYYDTENTYSIFVYHRPLGSRYDMLVGFMQVSSAK